MNFTLRRRIVLTLVPLLALPALLGVAAVLLLSRLGGRIDVILRENYDSVLYMERLEEALERIDSALQFALAGREAQAREQYAGSWEAYDRFLDQEKGNITLPGEAELVAALEAAGRDYRRAGDAFFAEDDPTARQRAYFGDGGRGLLARFEGVKEAAGRVLRLNQQNMEDASRAARATARSSTLGFALGLAAAAALALGWAARTVRTILQPVRAVTDSALAIGAGDLNQVVPVSSADELGQLAGAFNTMARQLREFRRSQQARLLRVQETTQAAIDSFPHVIVVVDPEGRVELANPAARRLLGVEPAGDASPAAARPWLPPEPLQEPLARALREQTPYLPESFEQTLPLASGAGGDERFFLPRVLPIRAPDGVTLGAALLLEDVTRFRLLDDVKSNLVATVSHEMKTPLTSIRLVVHLLLEEAVGPLAAKQAELLLDARDATERLRAMVENLLDLARLREGQGGLHLRPEDPAALLSAAADAARPRATDKGLTLAVRADPALPAVAADAARLAHALNNLLDNALHHTPPGGTVTLAAEPSGDGVTFTVADTGVGIPDEHRPHVFDRFYRVPGQTPAGGTGLGLAIVREIALAHGGAVTCDSRPGEGATFRLTVPAWRESPDGGKALSLTAARP